MKVLSLWMMLLAVSSLAEVHGVEIEGFVEGIAPNSQPSDLARARTSGDIWFNQSTSNRVSRLSRIQLSLTHFDLQSNSHPVGIAQALDEKFWVTERDTGVLQEIDLSGILVRQIPLPRADAQPTRIVFGPDGNFWFTAESPGTIGRLDPISGTLAEFSIPTPNSLPSGITVAPDGTLWFTEKLGNKIGRITTSGEITEFAIPTNNSAPHGIAAGPDNAIWFTEQGANKVGRLDLLTKVITEIQLPTTGAQPQGITLGADGNLWFAETAVNKLGIVAAGSGQLSDAIYSPAIVEIALPQNIKGPKELIRDIGDPPNGTGPFKALWFTHNDGLGLVKIAPASGSGPFEVNLSSSPIPAIVGKVVTITAVVLSTADVTSGTANFFDDAVNPVVPFASVEIKNGVARATTSFARGAHNIRVTVTIPGNVSATGQGDLAIAVIDEPGAGGGGGCFIATAAYGSYSHPDVKTLRLFRDRVLMNSAIGQRVISLYYSYSPTFADIIKDHDSLRIITIGVLKPIVFVLRHPWTLLVAASIVVLFWCRKRIR